jgi:hypothetical protein
MLRPKPPPRFLDAKRIDEEGDGHVTILYDRKAADEHAIAAASVTTASNLFAFTIYTHPCSLTPTDRYALSEPLLSFPRQKLVTTVHRLFVTEEILLLDRGRGDGQCWRLPRGGGGPKASSDEALPTVD